MSIYDFSVAQLIKIAKHITQTNAMDLDTKRNVIKSQLSDAGKSEIIVNKCQNLFANTFQREPAEMFLN